VRIVGEDLNQRVCEGRRGSQGMGGGEWTTELKRSFATFWRLKAKTPSMSGGASAIVLLGAKSYFGTLNRTRR